MTRPLLTWLTIITAETLHGILRRLLLVPLAGEQLSNQIGVFIGSGLILLVVYGLYDWLKVYSRPAQLRVGLLWCVLTIAFEFGLGYALGLETARMLADYDPRQGGLMLFGMAVMLFSLPIVARLRRQ